MVFGLRDENGRGKKCFRRPDLPFSFVRIMHNFRLIEHTRIRKRRNLINRPYMFTIYLLFDGQPYKVYYIIHLIGPTIWNAFYNLWNGENILDDIVRIVYRADGHNFWRNFRTYFGFIGLKVFENLSNFLISIYTRHGLHWLDRNWKNVKKLWERLATTFTLKKLQIIAPNFKKVKRTTRNTAHIRWNGIFYSARNSIQL
jgi:hypothetical protein